MPINLPLTYLEFCALRDLFRSTDEALQTRLRLVPALASLALKLENRDKVMNVSAKLDAKFRIMES